MLSIRSKLPQIWKRWRMVRKFPGKIFRKFGNRWISEMWSIQPKVLKIPGAKLNGKKTFGKKFLKLGYTTQGFLFFGNFWKCSSIRYCKFKKPEVWLNWKRPLFSGKFPTMMPCQIFPLSVSVGYAEYITQTLIPSPRRFKVQQMGSIFSYFFSKGDDSKEKDSSAGSAVQVRRWDTIQNRTLFEFNLIEE